jgi:O-antigen/teichoic acid export membrane protein
MTEQPEQSLLAKTAGGAGWVIGFRLVTRLLGIASTLTLVRLLGPGDFGLVALASSFAQTVDAFANLSPHEAVIRERAPDRAMYDTAFTMSFLRGLVTACVVAAGSAPAANFFHEPRLAPVLLALALSTLIGSVENIACVDFLRDFRFHKEFQLWTIPRVIQVIATVGFALLWPTYWALVFGILTGRTIRTGLSYVMRPYWPRLTLSAWRRITGFTIWSWAIYMVSMLRDRCDVVLVGRFFSSAQVGIYTLAGEIASLPSSELVEPLCRACFPSFSQLRHSGLGVAQTYLRLLGATALLVLPAGVGIAMVADPLVRVAFGPNWLAAIPLIQIFGIAAAVGALGGIATTLFSAHAMLRTTFTVILAGGVVRFGLMLALLPGGTLLTAALIGVSVGLCEQVAIIGVVMVRFHVRLAELARALWRSVLGAAAMGGALVWLGLGLVQVTAAPWTQMLGTAAAGAAIYVAVVGLAWAASGCPAGPERDLLALAGGVLRRLRGWRLPGRVAALRVRG